MSKRDSGQPLDLPFTVLVDQQEGRPYKFRDLRADAREGRRPLRVATRTVHLKTGDYSLEGMEDRVSVERKSLADLYGTLGGARERFERELARLQQMECATVVIEASWPQILLDPPEFSRLNPKTVHRSIIAWQQEFPRVHWWAAGDRRLAEVTTLRILQRFWGRQQAGG